LSEDDDFKNIRPDTLIFISTTTTDEAIVFRWAERSKPLCTIKKNNESSFILIEDGKERIIKYRNFRTESGNRNLTELGRFVSNSLVALCLQKTHSKSAKILNQNSAVQSARKKGKMIKGSTVLLFGNNIWTLKTMKDAHEFVASEYGYEKSYRTFVRELKKDSETGSANVLEFKKNDDILEVRLMGIL
jgi:hypothetical protein